jgi:hypothetical protein
MGGAAPAPSVTRIQRPVVLSSETGLNNVLWARCFSRGLNFETNPTGPAVHRGRAGRAGLEVLG